LIKAEQHIGHSAIFIKPASIHFAKLFGLIFMVDSIRGIKNNINAVSLDKTGPKN
jgi:hypothetical protein